MKKYIKRSLLGLAGLFIALQLVPVDRSNPSVDATHVLAMTPEVAAIMRSACYDCHSNETRWPWYTYVAPVSWWIADHIHEGRRKLNFSEWSTLTPKRQTVVLGRMEEQIMEGRMPLPSYLLMHPDARITPLQHKILSDWSNATLQQIYSATPPTPTR